MVETLISLESGKSLGVGAVAEGSAPIDLAYYEFSPSIGFRELLPAGAESSLTVAGHQPVAVGMGETPSALFDAGFSMASLALVAVAFYKLMEKGLKLSFSLSK